MNSRHIVCQQHASVDRPADFVAESGGLAAKGENSPALFLRKSANGSGMVPAP
jgi:hypothetical protein